MAFTRPKASQINFDLTNITDPLIRLNSGETGSADKDAGIVIERGNDQNVAIMYDESANQFAVVNTDEIGTTSGNVTIASYADIKANAFYGDGSNLTGIAGSYNDSDVATYLSANGYATSSSIIASITDSAPSTLNTLNELAAALGDDANFSTTVTTSIATKLPLAGGTMTGALTLNGAPTSSLHAATKAYVDSSVAGAGGGDVVNDTTPQLGGDLQSNGNDIDFADNDKAIFGAGSDLQIYHDGSHSHIHDSGTGSLIVKATDLFLQDASGNRFVAATAGAAVELYHNASAKLTTTASGATITGKLDVGSAGASGGTTGEIAFGGVGGSIDGFRIHNTGGNYLEFRPSSTNAPMVLSNTGNVGIGEVSPDTKLHISSASPDLRIEDTDTSRFLDILYGTRVATFRNTMASSEDIDVVEPSIVFSFKDDGETRTAMTIDHDSNVTISGTLNGTASSAKYADLAERYTTDEDYEEGTVLVFGGDEEVTQCTNKFDKRIAGVVSTDPAYLMNSELEGATVALVGRVPCKVIGEIRKGDLMVASDTPGHAEAWRDESNPPAGSIIGKALENKIGASTDVIEVVVGKN